MDRERAFHQFRASIHRSNPEAIISDLRRIKPYSVIADVHVDQITILRALDADLGRLAVTNRIPHRLHHDPIGGKRNRFLRVSDRGVDLPTDHIVIFWEQTLQRIFRSVGPGSPLKFGRIDLVEKLTPDMQSIRKPRLDLLKFLSRRLDVGLVTMLERIRECRRRCKDQR